MEVKIKATPEERIAVLNAIALLGSLDHITKMSHNLIAETANIKPTKVRVVLEELVAENLIEQLVIDSSTLREVAKVRRYYYLITDAGKIILSSAKS